MCFLKLGRFQHHPCILDRKGGCMMEREQHKDRLETGRIENRDETFWKVTEEGKDREKV